MTPPNDLVAVETPALDTSASGASVWWCGGGRVAVDVLADALRAADIEPPSPPSPVSALARAMRSLAGQSDLSRMLGVQRTKGRRALVEERRDDQDNLSYSIALRAEITGGELHVHDGDEGPRADELRASFADALAHYSMPDLSAWLVRDVLRKLDAVALRDAGGVYYIPPSGVARWKAVVAALRSCTGLVGYTMPTMRSIEAIEAVFAAIEREVQDVCVQFAEQSAEGGLGERALNARRDDLRSAKGKLARYEALLGRVAPHVHAQLAEVDNALIAALMTIAAEEA